MQAQAQLDRARLNIAYGTVAAPADGVVTRVDQMPVGAYLNAARLGTVRLRAQNGIQPRRGPGAAIRILSSPVTLVRRFSTTAALSIAAPAHTIAIHDRQMARSVPPVDSLSIWGHAGKAAMQRDQCGTLVAAAGIPQLLRTR